MTNIKLVHPETMQNIDQYAVALLTGLITLSTLEKFHVQALHLGILESDEEELSKTMHWEITRLKNLYNSQLEHLLKRTELTHETIAKYLMTLGSKPTKKRNSKPAKEVK